MLARIAVAAAAAVFGRNRIRVCQRAHGASGTVIFAVGVLLCGFACAYFIDITFYLSSEVLIKTRYFNLPSDGSYMMLVCIFLDLFAKLSCPSERHQYY